MRPVSRQIKDILAQAERIIQDKPNIVAIENFAKYSTALKSYLITNIDDTFILDQVKKIPDLKLEVVKGSGAIFTLLGVLTGGLFSMYETRRKAKAIEVVKEIRNKYASASVMLNNYFE